MDPKEVLAAAERTAADMQKQTLAIPVALERETIAWAVLALRDAGRELSWEALIGHLLAEAGRRPADDVARANCEHAARRLGWSPGATDETRG